MNRKMISLLMAVLVFAGALLYGCGKKNETPETEASAAETELTIPATTAEISGYLPEGQTEVTEGEGQESTAATMPTIPSENVQMGVVEGENDVDLDEDFEDEPAQTQPTQPKETVPPATQAPESDVLGDDFDFSTLTYESYNAMTGEQQKAVIDMFASPEEFMRWYKRAEEKYKEEHPDIEIGGDGNVNLG